MVGCLLRTWRVEVWWCNGSWGEYWCCLGLKIWIVNIDAQVCCPYISYVVFLLVPNSSVKLSLEVDLLVNTVGGSSPGFHSV